MVPTREPTGGLDSVLGEMVRGVIEPSRELGIRRTLWACSTALEELFRYEGQTFPELRCNVVFDVRRGYCRSRDVLRVLARGEHHCSLASTVRFDEACNGASVVGGGTVRKLGRTSWIGAGVITALMLDVLCGRRFVMPVELDYAGCTQVLLGKTPCCIFDPGVPLRLWLIRHDSRKATVHVDGERWSAEEYLVEGMRGVGLSVELPPDARRLSIDFVEPRAQWLMNVVSKNPDGSSAHVPTSEDVDVVLGRAYMTALAGNYVRALDLLDRVEPLASRYPKGRADLATYRAGVLWQQGRLHDAATALRVGVTFSMELRDNELLEDALPFYAGILAELGYADAAADWAEEALLLTRAGPWWTHPVRCWNRGKVLSTLGYVQLLLTRQRDGGLDHARALFEEALEWVGPGGRCPDPDSVPGIVLSLANVELDRGKPLEALLTLSAWGPLEGLTFDQQLRLEDVDLQARVRLGRPLAELQESLRRLEQAQAGVATPEGRWRLELRRGDILERQSHIDEAEVAYSEAEKASQRLAELAAVGVGRYASVVSHAQSAERLAHLLVDQGRRDEALCVLREARARQIQAVGRRPSTHAERLKLGRAIEGLQAAQRVHEDELLRSRELPRREREIRIQRIEHDEEQRLSELTNEILQAQSTWRPACDELVPRRINEVVLGLYPAQGGWFVFLQDDEGTEARWLDGGPSYDLGNHALGEELLAPWIDRLGMASQVRVLAAGQAQEVDVHLLAVEGRRLVEMVPVVYGTELPRFGSMTPSPGRVALLVRDPTGSLRNAERDVKAAAEWMEAREWVVDSLGPEDADRSRVLDALERVSLFYFSGHGEHDVGDPRVHALPPYAGGVRAWPGRLALKLPTELEVHDVLMLDSAPRHVVLLGCETGVPMGNGGGMSLALAFLVGGAEEVVASPTNEDDSVSYATGLGLLSGISEKGVSLTDGVHSAQREMLLRGEEVGRYRVLVR